MSLTKDEILTEGLQGFDGPRDPKEFEGSRDLGNLRS
jgi:hypothetical protein